MNRILVSIILFICMIVLIQCAPKVEIMGEAVPPGTAEPIPPVSPVNVQVFSWEYFQLDGFPTYALLSPDGNFLASVNNRGICVYSFVVDQNQCYSAPEHLTVISPVWSPDSRYIAFNEDAFRFLQESDIWIFDVTNAEYHDLTDDGIADTLTDVHDKVLLVDYQPTWNPVTGDLYFLRTEWQPGDTDSSGPSRTTLNRISVEGGDPEELLDVTETMPYGLVYQFYPTNFPVFGNSASISPNGSYMAVLVRPIEPSQILDKTGIWLINLTTLDTPRELVGYAGLSSGLPTYAQDHLGTLMPIGLAWAAGGHGLVEFSFDALYVTQPPAQMVYYIDVESGQSTPINDFSAVTDVEQFMPPPRDRFRRPTPSPTPVPLEDHPDLLFDVPASAALSADGSILYMLNMGWSQQGITALTLPPDGSAPIQIYTGDESWRGNPFSYSSSGGSRVLLGSLVLEFGE